MLDLGDAINDIQTTPNGQIWVSYFDEGVFGLGIGRSGVVCFNSDGTQAFKFDELSQAEGLPFIDDCYGMNVTKDGDVWLNYYSDFPLIHLRRGLVERVWENFGSMGSAFAIHDRHVLYLQDGSLISRDLDNPELIEPIKLHDDEGKELFPTEIEGLQAAGRGEHFVVSTSSGVYKLCR